MANNYVISSPVVDLKRTPSHFSEKNYAHQAERETQLLFGEQLELLKEADEWLYVAALEQLIFDEEQGWVAYKGWVHCSEVEQVSSFTPPRYAICAPTVSLQAETLSYGTLLHEAHSQLGEVRALSKTLDRRLIVEEARYFLELPYLWGGRAFQLPGSISSVDCSGLINLLYRAQGIILPRNAYDQYLKCSPTKQLQAGDPLYLAKEKRIHHVILKLDEKTFIEAPQTGQQVRLLHWGKEIWEVNGRIHIFDREGSYLPYPGSFV